MKVTIHRGQNQIGGSIIEVSTDKTKLVFDIGVNLDEEGEPKVPQIEGLFCGERSVDAVFISHYHADHVGLINNLLPGIPVYVAEVAYGILKASKDYFKRALFKTSNYYKDGSTINIGDIEITPIKCDHSAYDAYMFLIKADGKTILYTGDFRSNGRANFEELLNRLSHVDALIIEGTMLSRDTFKKNITEQELEDIALERLKEYKGPCFVEVAAMNIDRLITLKNVAEKSGRILLLDTYIASVMRKVGGEAPVPDKKKNIRVFQTNQKYYQLLITFGSAKIGRKAIAKSDYIMCVRASMRKTLELLNQQQSFENGILFYSMWSGYQERQSEKDFLAFMESKGVKIHKLHTSGHADTNAIKSVLDKTTPDTLIPVHTENAQWYKDNCDSSIKVVLDQKEIGV